MRYLRVLLRPVLQHSPDVLPADRELLLRLLGDLAWVRSQVLAVPLELGPVHVERACGLPTLGGEGPSSVPHLNDLLRLKAFSRGSPVLIFSWMISAKALCDSTGCPPSSGELR